MAFVVEARVEDYAVALSSPHPLDDLFERLAAETRDAEGIVFPGDVDPEAQEIARRYAEEAGLADRIDYRLGPGLETMRSLDGPLDLVFIDADKEGYLDYYEAALPMLADEGLVVADNVLWSGRVAEDDPDERTRTIMAFNDHVRNDSRIVAVVLTVRDGMTLIRKRSAG